MENTSQSMDVNAVDLGDESSVSPTLGIGVTPSKLALTNLVESPI